MPFGRSHGRSKSRSPAVRSSPAICQSSRPPTFLPPSHYAAAAGLPYPGPPRAPVNDDSCVPSLPTQSPVQETSVVESSESQTSQSSTMGRLMRRVSSKRFTVSLTRSESRTEREKDSTEPQNSQFTDIPLLETQLLPSLKDTVDRMTQCSQPRSNSGGSLDGQSTPSSRSSTSHRRREDRKTSPSLTSLPPPVAHTSRSTGELSTPTGIPRFTPASSPGPKSVLKSPARRNKPAQTSTHPTAASSRSTVDQLDPSRSLHSGSETNSDECNSLPNRPRPGALPASSIPTPRTPTALQKLRAKTKPKSNPSTPLQNPTSSLFATPQPSRTTLSPFVQTSLPRPKATRFHNLPTNDSGSELARKVDRTLSPGRLVVTNATVMPSSSESEDSMSVLRRPHWSSPRSHLTAAPQVDRTPRSNSQPKPKVPLPRALATHLRGRSRGSVGLGLNVEVDGHRVKRSSSSDEEAMYDKYSDSSLMDEPVLFPTTGDDDESVYDDELPQGFSQRNRRSIYQHGVHLDRRREEALKGLVDGFHRDYRRSVTSNPRSSIAQSSGGADYDVQGVAISDSTEIHTGHSSGSDSRGSHTEEDWGQASAYLDQDVRDPRSLRHTNPRHSWKRPSSAMALRESIYLEQHGQPAMALLDSDGYRPSVSPTLAGGSSRSRSPGAGTKSPRSTSAFPAATSHVHPTHTADSRASDNHKRRLSRRMSVSVRRYDSGPKSPSPTDSGSDTFSPRPVLSSSEASSVDVNLRDERLAFGIPDSLSFCGSSVSPDEDESIRPPYSRMNSTTSSTSKRGRQRADSNTSDGGWRHHHQKFSKELSRGASALFETLTSKVRSNGRQARVQPNAQNNEREQDRTPVMDQTSWTTSTATRNTTAWSPRPNSGPEVPLASAPSPPRRCLESATEPSCSSLGSVYDPELPMPPYPVVQGHLPAVLPLQVAQRDIAGSWRSTLAPGVFNSLSAQYSGLEMDRQQVIHELVIFDREFVKFSRRVIRTYFLPLRTRDSRAWLSGIPPDMARLFDWLEDIVNLHAAISRALAPLVVVWKEGMIVERVTGTLRGFVPQLEIYMPYLVKLESAKAAMKWYIEQDEGEFGEYLRMKAGEVRETDGEDALERLVSEPRSRLARYVELFQRICDATPRDHPDYLSSISLFHSTRMAVRVMEEVKAREEEYDFVKDLATRIDGLSSTVPLARRARRLLWYGTLLYPESTASPTPKVVAKLPGSPLRPNVLRSPRANKLTRSPAQRGSKLATAVRDWDKRRSQRGSISSSQSSLLSVQSPDMTPSTSSASELATPRSGQRLHGFGLLGRSGLRAYDSPKLSEELSQILNGNRLGDEHQERTRERMLKVMVFTDVIVLTTASPSAPGAQSDDEERMDKCRLLDGLGLSRVLDFAESDAGLSLTLIPVRPEQLDTDLIADDTRIAPVTLCLPAGTTGGERQRLLDGLRKSQHHTFRSLSMPTLPGTLMEDLEIDTRQSLVGILSSGLPLPKSPSIQFEEAQKGLRRDVADGEREERGWWTLRFHQVLRELQREEGLVPLIVPGTPGEGTAQ